MIDCLKLKILRVKKEILKIISIPIHCVWLKRHMPSHHLCMQSLMSVTNFYVRDIFAWIKILPRAGWFLIERLLSRTLGSLRRLKDLIQSHSHMSICKLGMCKFGNETSKIGLSFRAQRGIYTQINTLFFLSFACLPICIGTGARKKQRKGRQNVTLRTFCQAYALSTP